MKPAQIQNAWTTTCVAGPTLPRSARGWGTMQGGFTLVEMMVALTIGLLLLVGLADMFFNISNARGELDKASRQIESLYDLLGTFTGEKKN